MRRRFVKSSGWVDTLSLGLFGGRTSALVLFLIALLLVVATSVQPGLLKEQRGNLTDALAPVLEAFSAPFTRLAGDLDYLYSLTRLKTEAAELRAENNNLREWYNTALLLQAENRSLRDLLKVKLDPSLSFVTTRVIGDGGGPYVRTLLIGAGKGDGIDKGDAVMAGEGLIGRIINVQEKIAEVLLITDVNSRIPVRVGSGSLQGILAGTNGSQLVIDRLPEGSSVPDCSRVMTSGVGGVFPPDLPVGEATAGESGVVLKPYADFGRLLYVRVVRMPNEDKMP